MMVYLGIVLGILVSVAIYCTAKEQWRQYRLRKIYGRLGERYINHDD